MSEASAKKLIKPIIIKNNNKMVIHPSKLYSNFIPMTSIQQYKDEVIYSSPNCDFLKGEPQDILIVNRLNLLNKSCRTIARCTQNGNTVESSSDNVVSAIGQKNYETVLTALSSVFNEETKVRGILAILSVKRKINSISTQTTMEISESRKQLISTESQTDDTRLNFPKEKLRKRMRRQPLTPYVVTEKEVKKCVINLSDVKNDIIKKKAEEKFKEKTFPDLRTHVDEDSNISTSSDISLSSLPSLPGVLENASIILNHIDKYTEKKKVCDSTLNSTEIRLRDGSVIMIPVKPEDDFHIATPEVLKNVTHEERMKLIWHQAFIDFKLCLEQNEDGYYPLHLAVLHNDVDLVRRQCASLRARHESVDLPAAELTALHMAVRQNVSVTCTNILLQNGADPLLCDNERRCSLHLAAEMESSQLKTLLAYCDNHARRVLKTNGDFWQPELESKSDEELTTLMYKCINEMFDHQGYNPLMIAAEAAIPANVDLLATRAGPLVDTPAPDCGATALYRAVAKACLYAKETGNTTKTPEKYLKTIEVLVEHGADPSIENHSGSSVNTLLTEFNISHVSMTIANKMTAMKHGKINDRLGMMLYKHSDGRIGFKDIKPEARNVDNGLHAVITVDIPKKSKRDSDITADLKKRDSDNLSVGKESGYSNEGSVIANVNSNVRLLKDVQVNKISNVTDNISYKEGNKTNANENKIKMPVKIGNVVWKPTDDKVAFDSANALKVSLKGIKDGNLGNVTFKRLSTGQMIAIKKDITNTEKNSYVKINPTHTTEFEETNRSPKERKTENVVIVENVPVKSFLKPNMTAGTSKTARPKDILIKPAPKILNDDLAAKELSMEGISPDIIISSKIVKRKHDNKTVKWIRKKKQASPT